MNRITVKVSNGMLRCFLCFGIMLLSRVSIGAQTAIKADELFQKQQYDAAAKQYEDLLKKQPQQVLYIYRYARCMQELGETEVAISYFLQAGDKYALRNFYLGELLFSLYRFQEAADYYEDYLETIEPTHEWYAYTKQQIVRARKAERYMHRVEDIVVLDSIVLPKAKFLTAYRLSAEAGTLTQKGDGVEFLNQRKDRMYFSTKDDSGQVSIVACQRLLDSWSECDTLPPEVNSSANEDFPFVLSDGVTMYFASDREDGLGGYDIWFTQYNSETDTWLAPENAGMPFNSFRNDYMLAIDETLNVGWFATDRRCADSLVVVYKFVPNAEKKILRTESDDYIRAAAQMLRFRKEDAASAVASSATEVLTRTAQKENGSVAASVFFAYSDEEVYTSPSDFASYDARVIYLNYLKEKSAYEAEVERLTQLRHEYNAETADKQLLALQIEQLEASLPKQKQELKLLLNKVYSLEHGVRHDK